MTTEHYIIQEDYVNIEQLNDANYFNRKLAERNMKMTNSKAESKHRFQPYLTIYKFYVT